MGECGITNLAACISEKFYEFTLRLINAPLEPLLSSVKGLLTEPVNIEVFKHFWLIIAYIISLFYGLFFLFAGFNFLIAGFDAARKEQAKEWLKNIILMIIFVQSSFFLYTLILDISALMSAGIINMINSDFFLITIDNLANIGLELLFYSAYALTLLSTLILLAIRYLVVSVGILFFPLGLFLYFIPPLRSYGKLVLNVLFVTIFIPFIFCLMLLASSLLLDIPVFQNFKILIMISSFQMVNATMLFLIVFAIIKSAFSLLSSDVGRAVKMTVGYFT